MGDSIWGTASSWIWLLFLCHSPWCLLSKGEGERPQKENIIFKSLEVCEIPVHRSFFTSGLQSSNPCSEHRFWGQFFFLNYYLSLLLKAVCQLFQKHVTCSTGRWEMSSHCCIQSGNGRKLGSLKCVPSFGRVESSRHSRAPCRSRQAVVWVVRQVPGPSFPLSSQNPENVPCYISCYLLTTSWKEMWGNW